MEITRSSTKAGTSKGSADWFTGDVYVDTVAAPSGPSRVGAANVHFTPGARTAWHTHPLGQTLIVTQGLGWVQREGGPREEVRPGDVVCFGPPRGTNTAPPSSRARAISPSNRPRLPSGPPRIVQRRERRSWGRSPA